MKCYDYAEWKAKKKVSKKVNFFEFLKGFRVCFISVPVLEKCAFFVIFGLYVSSIVIHLYFYNSKYFWVNKELYLAVVLSNYQLFVTAYAQSSVESCRRYTKALGVEDRFRGYTKASECIPKPKRAGQTWRPSEDLWMTMTTCGRQLLICDCFWSCLKTVTHHFLGTRLS